MTHAHTFVDGLLPPGLPQGARSACGPEFARRARARGAPLAAAWLVLQLLGGCSSQPQVPDWQMNAHAAAQKALEAYLSGNDRVEALEWARARAEVARTGRPDLLARLELLRCAAQVASLEPDRCDRFEPLRADAAVQDKAYADYLAGTLQPEQVQWLPEAQRKAVLMGGEAAAGGAGDPLSRLVAAGALFRAGRASPDLMAHAVETASAQGWRRPLLAWLGLQARQADASGQAEAAAALRRRMAVVEQGGRTPR